MRGEGDGELNAKSGAVNASSPVLSEKRGTKPMGCDEGNGNYRHLQLDFERQAHRPIKRVKSVVDANFSEQQARV